MNRNKWVPKSRYDATKSPWDSPNGTRFLDVVKERESARVGVEKKESQSRGGGERAGVNFKDFLIINLV